MEKEFSTFMDGDCLECDSYEKENDRLKTEIRTERTLSLDLEQRIKTLESAMQEFVDTCDKILGVDVVPIAYTAAAKFKQLLEENEKESN